jgi:hypothetical protein
MTRRQGLKWRLSYDACDTHHTRVNVEDAGELDELVLDKWFHIERMDNRAWWLRIGDANVWAHIGPDGRAMISIARGDYDGLGGWTTTSGGTVKQAALPMPKLKRAKKKAGRR